MRIKQTLAHSVRCTVVHLLLGGAALSAAQAGPQPVPLSADARSLVAQVRQMQDHDGAPFLVLDKRSARLWVFDAQARLIDSAPVLLGAATGDDSVPGIGELPLAQIKPEQRTTPAGRFVIEPGRNLSGDDILWIDYDAAVSMHRVRSANAAERRLQRLASHSAADNRISYGCINVPVAFFDRVLQPLFAASQGIAYVLPETRSSTSVFPFMAQGGRSTLGSTATAREVGGSEPASGRP